MSASREDRQAERIEELERQLRTVREQLARALAENERLRKQLEEALRGQKRQAAPFSKGEPKAHPHPPGRKAGRAYGLRASRPIPSRVDEILPAPLPAHCPGCGGPVVYEETKPQYQEEIVRQTRVRRFDVEIGRCRDCHRRVQGRHPLQTSDALGAAQVQMGPEALTLAAHLNKEMGLSHERVARVLDLGYGLRLSRSALCRALLRLADKAAPTYEQLRAAVGHSPVAWLDETGWRVAAQLEWLWVLLNRDVTVYTILPGRGFEEAASILSADYRGFLHHDGWAPYYRFRQAHHQSCLAHLIRRCRDLTALASPMAGRFPRAVQRLLETGLALRDRFYQRTVSLDGLDVATGRLEAALDRLLDRHYRSPANQRLAKHLDHERPYLFTFLYCPGLDATNNRAERALRPAVLARKTWGGNRTYNGAQAQQILTSVLATCRQQGKESFPRLAALLRSPAPPVLDIVPASQSP